MVKKSLILIIFWALIISSKTIKAYQDYHKSDVSALDLGTLVYGATVSVEPYGTGHFDNLLCLSLTIH